MPLSARQNIGAEVPKVITAVWKVFYSLPSNWTFDPNTTCFVKNCHIDILILQFYLLSHLYCSSGLKSPKVTIQLIHIFILIFTLHAISTILTTM